MLSPEAARHCLSDELAISVSAWLSLCDLLEHEPVHRTVDGVQAAKGDDGKKWRPDRAP
jgi:hypothetical protein